MISYKAAKRTLLKSNIRIKKETINSLKSLNRICVKDVYSPANYPAGNNTAFDGYAVNSKDTINAIFMLVRKRKAGIFNIGSGKKISLSSIIYYLNKFFKKKIKINHKHKNTFLIANNTKLRRMGWKSKYNFFSELTDILKYKTSK